ncbi:hypothetical protein [Mycoplasma sp. E35C]|uniref:hypothetical protein n=1 Tax=Mycoplasma sp. E35C TaxID=2801918 RepID=UPI001CA4080E|nr:hypothetical protein [Mycoplasma sp. E35C]QZX49275.1 hypothetical protein JJE79_00715 [Mycoplasma sp. E35C]
MSRLNQNKIVRETKKKQAQLNKIFDQEDKSVTKYKNDLERISNNILLDYRINKPNLFNLKVNYSQTNSEQLKALKELIETFDSHDLINIIEQARFLTDYSKDITSTKENNSWILKDVGLVDIKKIENDFESIKHLAISFNSNSNNDLMKLKHIIKFAQEQINDEQFFKPVDVIEIAKNKNKSRSFKILLITLITLMAVCIIFLFVIFGIYQ